MTKRAAEDSPSLEAFAKRGSKRIPPWDGANDVDLTHRASVRITERIHILLHAASQKTRWSVQILFEEWCFDVLREKCEEVLKDDPPSRVVVVDSKLRKR